MKKRAAIADLFYEVYSYSRDNNIKAQDALDEYFKMVIWSSTKAEWDQMSAKEREELNKRFVSYINE